MPSMPDETAKVDDRDDVAPRRAEYRGARLEEGHPRYASGAGGSEAGVVSSDDAQVASEPMTAEGTLSRLREAEPGRVPPGRQLSGDPPASPAQDASASESQASPPARSQ